LQYLCSWCCTNIAIPIPRIKNTAWCIVAPKGLGGLIPKSILLRQTSLNPVPDAQVCVYLTIHITKLQLQTTFPKPLYIWHFTCIHQDPDCWKSWCLHHLWPPWDNNIQLTMGIDQRQQIYLNVVQLVSK
jgi:hypothetical protein